MSGLFKSLSLVRDIVIYAKLVRKAIILQKVARKAEKRDQTTEQSIKIVKYECINP